MQKFIGVDIGGTNVKFGLVDEKGTLLEKVKYPTKDLMDTGDFMKAFSDIMKVHLNQNPEVERVGIGIPGTISKDGKGLKELANIPVLNNTPVIDILEKAFPSKHFYLDNDANAAALGEYYFTEAVIPESYIFITLGTGVGGGCILNKQIFKGGNGNAMEIGHMLTHSGDTVEHHIGKKGLVAYTLKELNKGKKSRLDSKDEIDAKAIVKAAKKGDKVAQKTLDMMGAVLGECIVSTVRTLDIHTILIGGGVAKAYEMFKEPMFEVINEYLTPYYLEDLDIHLASLGNDAGMLGAASLCMGHEAVLETV